MDEELEYFLENFGPPLDAEPLPTSFIKQYDGVLPKNYLDFLEQIGLAGYADGIIWCTDPEPFKAVTDVWLEKCSPYHSDEYIVFARTAFGHLYLWGKKSGNNIRINTLDGIVTTSPPKPLVATNSDLVIGSFFANLKTSSCDFEDENEKKMFAKALKKLGPLHKDEMYAFEPALSIGGMPTIDNLSKLEMIPHLVLLAQLSEIQFNHIDVSRHI